VKLILHIGMPKCGTTALQRTLRSNAAVLKENGILYPVLETRKPDHNILTVGLYSLGKLSRNLAQKFRHDPGAALGVFERRVGRLRAQLEDGPYDYLIISAEGLFRPPSEERVQAFEAILRSMASEIHLVAYVRHPAGFYLSMAQQILKASSRIPAPKGRPVRPAIEAFAPIADTVTVAPYDRAAMVAGDVTHDFVHRVLPDKVDMLSEITPISANETMSAEAMDVLQRYREATSQALDGRFTRDTNLLIEALRESDATLEGFGRPRLLETVARQVVGSAPDLVWLRERHGIVFPDVDYATLADGPSEGGAVPERIADICHLDPARSEALQLAAMQRLALRAADPAA
jgi:hypothetical protein